MTDELELAAQSKSDGLKGAHALQVDITQSLAYAKYGQGPNATRKTKRTEIIPNSLPTARVINLLRDKLFKEAVIRATTAHNLQRNNVPHL